MKKVHVFRKTSRQEKEHVADGSNTFVFCEKTIGLTRFRAAANADLNCTVERIGGLLAMHCLVRGYNPGDFDLMVPAEEVLTTRIAARAEELLEEGRSFAGPCALSPRQREILHSVLRNRANKEIASRLNITVRTVKFHVSTLLNKFGVENRAELARRATGFLRTAASSEMNAILAPPHESDPRQGLSPVAV